MRLKNVSGSQQVRVVATKLKDLGSIPRSYNGERRELTPNFCEVIVLYLHTWTPGHSCTNTHTRSIFLSQYLRVFSVLGVAQLTQHLPRMNKILVQRRHNPGLWLTFIILALWRWSQIDQELKVIFDYIAGVKPAWEVSFQESSPASSKIPGSMLDFILQLTNTWKHRCIGYTYVAISFLPLWQKSRTANFISVYWKRSSLCNPGWSLAHGPLHPTHWDNRHALWYSPEITNLWGKGDYLGSQCQKVQPMVGGPWLWDLDVTHCGRGGHGKTKLTTSWRERPEAAGS